MQALSESAPKHALSSFEPDSNESGGGPPDEDGQSEDTEPMFEGTDKSEEDRKELESYMSDLKTKLDGVIKQDEQISAAMNPVSERSYQLTHDIQVEWNKELDDLEPDHAKIQEMENEKRALRTEMGNLGASLRKILAEKADIEAELRYIEKAQ